jgi:hypothetical protein
MLVILSFNLQNVCQPSRLIVEKTHGIMKRTVHLLQEPRQQMQLLWALTANVFGVNRDRLNQ